MIRVLFFAHIQDAIGKESIVLEDGPLTVSDLKAKLLSEYQLKQLEQIMFAINEEYAASDDELIQNGDVVALIPPVSGG